MLNGTLNGQLIYKRMTWYHGETKPVLKDSYESKNLTLRRAALLMRSHLRRLKCSPTALQLDGNKIFHGPTQRATNNSLSSEAYIIAPRQLNIFEFNQIVKRIEEGL